jgi:glycosyltransferase involved in cell wall biosynthesis
MKKILILAYDFPPYVSVGGLRPYSWYKYFHEFGLHPVVVTRQWGNKYGNHLDYVAAGESDECIVEETEQGTIIRTPYKPNLSNRLLLKYGENRFKIIRKIITAFYEFAQWFFFIGPKVGLYKGAEEYLKKNKVDCIIATGEPFVLFRYASKLSQKYNLPWVADYRDPWLQNNKRSMNKIHYFINLRLEKRYLQNVEFIITVSDFLKNIIRRSELYKGITIIRNGFDEIKINLKENIDENITDLSIAFAGSIYDWHPWKSFLKVIDEIEINDFNIMVIFYGINKQVEIERYIQQNCKNKHASYVFHDKIANDKLIDKLSKSHAFLLFNDYSILGTKIFDYIALKKKIIFCYKNEVGALLLKEKHFCVDDSLSKNQSLQEDLIIETNSGIIVKDKDHLREVLINLHKEFNEKGFIACESFGFEKYSRREQVKELARVIGGVTG